MAGARLKKTQWPGIYRRGKRYVFEYTVWTPQGPRRRRETVRTIDEARRDKAKRESEARRGGAAGEARETFEHYALEWISRYQGRGRKGFRENTRAEYRRDLIRYALTFWGGKVKVAELTPRNVAEFVGWLCNDAEQKKRHARENDDRRRRTDQARREGADRAKLRALQPLRLTVPLSDETVRRILAPVRACLASAVREGVIMANPATGAALPHRPDFNADDEETEARPLTGEQLAMFLAIAPSRYRVMFALLATTGLRISEAIALEWRHLELDGTRPLVKVRRAYVKGTMGPPKSQESRREVPVSAALVDELRAWRKVTGCTAANDLVFPGRERYPVRNGREWDPQKLLDQSNLRSDSLVPTAQEAGVPWIGFHTFRHTCASTLFDRGRNVKQVQRWLGHADPAFTLRTYVHLFEDDLGDALDVEGVGPGKCPPRRTSPNTAEVAGVRTGV